jgi:hypothetical protein
VHRVRGHQRQASRGLDTGDTAVLSEREDTRGMKALSLGALSKYRTASTLAVLRPVSSDEQLKNLIRILSLWLGRLIMRV